MPRMIPYTDFTPISELPDGTCILWYIAEFVNEVEIIELRDGKLYWIQYRDWDTDRSVRGREFLRDPDDLYDLQGGKTIIEPCSCDRHEGPYFHDDYIEAVLMENR